MEKITLPQEYRSWYNKTVIIARALRRRVFLYTPESFKKLTDKMRENMEKNGTTYPKFHDFIKAGTYEVTIGSNGKLILPDKLLKYIYQTGEMTIKQNEFGLEIGRIRPEECSCDNPSCMKCLLINCRDNDCTIHTKERKHITKQSQK